MPTDILPTHNLDTHLILLSEIAAISLGDNEVNNKDSYTSYQPADQFYITVTLKSGVKFTSCGTGQDYRGKQYAALYDAWHKYLIEQSLND